MGSQPAGQVSGSGDEYLYQRLRELAREREDSLAMRKLDSIAPYPRVGAPVSDVLLQRKWARRIDGGRYGKPTFDLLFALPPWAPEYSAADVAAQEEATRRCSKS